MLRVWNVTLVITTFFLTIFGTFMTRSGVVQSVHAFGEDPWLAKLFTGFMIADRHLQLRLGDLPAAAAEVAPRARLVGVARGGVPRQQLDPAVLGVLRPVRDDVPDAQRSGARPAPDGRRRRSSTCGCARSGWRCWCSPASRRCSPGASRRSRNLLQSFAWPVAGGDGDGRGGRTRSASACGRRASASRCARSSAPRSCRSSSAAPQVRRGASGVGHLHRDGRPGRALSAAATAATSSTSASS